MTIPSDGPGRSSRSFRVLTRFGGGLVLVDDITECGGGRMRRVSKLMNPPVVLADQEGASNAAETGLKLPVVLADQEGASNAAETGFTSES